MAKHKPFCFAGQPAACKGYFPGDLLPCICGVEGSVTKELARLCIPTPILRRLISSGGSRPTARNHPASRH